MARTLGPLAFFLVVSIAYNQHAWADPAHLYSGGGADPQQTMWFLDWVPHALANHTNPLLTNYLNYPAGVNLMWQTSEPLIGVITAPLTAFFGIVVTYNVLVTVATTLAGWTAFIALRRYTRSWPGSVLGGLLFAFSPYVIGQSLGHANLLWIAGLPLMVMLADDIVRGQSHRWWRDGLLLGLLVSALVLVSEELLAIDGITCLVMFAIAWIVSRRSRINWPHVIRAAGLAALTTVLLCAWPVATQLFGPDRLTGLPEGHDIFATDALGFVVPSSLQFLAPSFAQSLSNHFSGNLSEFDGYLGLPLLVLALWAVWRHRTERVAQVVACSAVVIALFSLGPHLHLRGHLTHIPMPWIVFDNVPLLRDLLPNRFAYAVSLGVAYFLAVAVADLITSKAALFRWSNIALVAAAAITLWPAGPAITSAAPSSNFFTDDAASYIKAGTTALIIPPATGSTPDAMFWQIQSGFRFKQPAGYFVGSQSAGNGRMAEINSELTSLSAGSTTPPADINAARAYLSSAGVTVAVVTSTNQTSAIARYLDALSGKGPVSTDGVEVWTLSR